MAAIGRSCSAGCAAVVLFAWAIPMRADRAADVRAQVTYVASALASGNPTDALTAFDKGLPEYEKLSEYFAALTNNYDVVSEIEIADEDDQEKESILKANWTLQISDKVNNSDVRRTFDVTIHLKPLRGKWKIFKFAPLEMFNPQAPSK